MKLAGSFWYTFMIPESVVGYGRLWSICGWFFSNSSSGIVFLTASSNNNYYLYSSLICTSCALEMLVGSFLLFVLFMWLYGSTKRTEFTLGLCRKNVALGAPELDVSIFLLNSFGIDTCLWLFEVSVIFIHFS